MAGPSREGEIIEGKYRILRLLGEGGMGAVYAGEHVRLKKSVAIKVLHAGANSHAEMADRFEREAQAAGQIGSDHIVEVFDIGATPSGERFMVMEYLEGEPLRTRLKRLRKLREVEVAELASQLLEGLGAAHRAGIVHRDLKPDNVFICREKAGRRDFVKVLDFGISKFAQAGEAGSVTKTGTIMGSPNYMSPEHVQASHEVDARSDLYSVGVVLFEAITGKIPRKAATFAEILFKVVYEPVPDPRTVDPDLDPDFAAIVMKACAHRKDQRYQTAEEFKAALEGFAGARRGSVTGAFADPVTPGTSDGFRTVALSPGALPPPAPRSNPGSISQPQATSQPSFGASSQPAFGAGSQPSFGAGSHPSYGGQSFSGSHPIPPSHPGMAPPSSSGAFPASPGLVPPQPVGAISQPSFGASSQPSFGSTSQPSVGASSQPSFGNGSQPSFGNGSQPSFGAGSQPSFGNGSQPSYASQFSVTHQPYGAEPAPRRKLGVIVALGAAAFAGIAIAAVLATRQPETTTAAPPKATSTTTSAPASTTAPIATTADAPAASTSSEAASPSASASAAASEPTTTTEPSASKPTGGGRPQGGRPGGKPGGKPDKPQGGPSAGY